MDIKPYLDHTDQLFEVYTKLNLQSIDDFHTEDRPEYNGKNFLSYFTDVTRSRTPLTKFDKSDFKMYDDLLLLSGDIKFCAGMLNYLYPHISKHSYEFPATIIDRRYLMHISFGYQSIYHFWDRIGDLLWLYFPTEIKKRQVYTGTVLDAIKINYHNSQTFIDLEKSYHSFNAMFKLRHDIVHNCSFGTEIYWEKVDYWGNDKKFRRMMLKMKRYQDNITKSLPQCIDALGLALSLILELPKKVYSE